MKPKTKEWLYKAVAIGVVLIMVGSAFFVILQG